MKCVVGRPRDLRGPGHPLDLSARSAGSPSLPRAYGHPGSGAKGELPGLRAVSAGGMGSVPVVSPVRRRNVRNVGQIIMLAEPIRWLGLVSGFQRALGVRWKEGSDAFSVNPVVHLYFQVRPVRLAFLICSYLSFYDPLASYHIQVHRLPMSAMADL
jgi:hypothetical protein